MGRVFGWTALAGGVVAFILALRAFDRAESGPYGDIVPNLRPPVPPEWKWTYRIVATLWSLVSAGLVVLAAYLLPSVKWLQRFRVSPSRPHISTKWVGALFTRFEGAAGTIWNSTSSHVSRWFASIVVLLSRSLSHWFVWDLILCLVGAIVIEVHYEYLRASDPKLARTERYWAFRGLYRILASLQLAVRLWLAGLVLAFAGSMAWNWAARHGSWPAIPPLNLEHLLANPGDHAFYKLMLCCSAVMSIGVTLWYRRKPIYDVFLSYKSRDAGLVREVGDRLIAGGARVWLAEYEIPLRKSAHFLRYIASGIRRSRYGLAFTHDLYARSPYCRGEMEGLLRSCGPRKTLCVKLADTDAAISAFRGMEQAPVLRTDGDAGEILAFVERHTGLKSTGQMPAHFTRTSYEGTWASRKYELDTTGWEPAKGASEAPHLVVGPILHYIQGPPHLLFNLDIRTERSPAARVRETADDRQMYEELKQYVPTFLGEVKGEARGIHLFFHSGLSQMAVTYRIHDHWARKYSVILKDPRDETAAEFMFTFGFLGPFQGLCGLTPVMERLVQSLKW